MKHISLILASCVAVTASAATFDAQGKTIDSKDAKNPGIIKFEKNKTAAAKNNLNKPSSLAKTYTPTRVQARKATYDQNTNTYTLNNENNTISEAAYLSQIDSYEQHDNPRQNDWSNSYTDNGIHALPNKTGNNCSRVNYTVSTNFDYTYATSTAYSHGIPLAIGTLENAYNYNMLTKTNNPNISARCLGLKEYKNTCGLNIHIYNIAGDAAVSFNGNSCTDSRTKNYKEGIKHYYAVKFINHLAERATTHYYQDRNGNKFAQHPSNPYSKNMHIGNIISSPYKNQTVYNTEAAALDDYIYNNRVIEFAPYTNEGGRTGAGLALNAITVAGATGQWNKSGNPAGHKTLINNLDFPLLKKGNSNSKYLKPEIYNVSNGLFSFEIKIKHDNNEYEYDGITDDWGASTIAATMTADLLERYPFYKWHPEVVKALWLSAKSEKETDTERRRVDIYHRNASTNKAGTLTQFDDLLFDNNSRYWYGNNTDFLSNNKITFTENVEAGQNYAFAIAWLVRGDYALNEYNLSTNFKLTVSYKLPSGSTKTFSSSDGGINRPATYRLLPSINIPSGVSKVTVTIERTKDTGDRIVLGYNRHKKAKKTKKN